MARTAGADVPIPNRYKPPNGRRPAGACSPDRPLSPASPETVAVSLFTLFAAWREPALVAVSLIPLVASFAAAGWRLLW